MKIEAYIGGVFGLFKDFFRFIVFGLKNPHYVVVILVLIVGIFYFYGIPPREISGFVSGKWNAFVENRKQTFKEDYQLISKRFFKKEAAFEDQEKREKQAAAEAKKKKEKKAKEHAEKQIRQMQEETFGWQQAFDAVKEEEKEAKQQKKENAEQKIRQMKEETFGWQQALTTEKTEEKPVDENAIRGILTVVGADRVRIGGKTFSLNVRLRSGKAREAFQTLKQRFNGGEGRCFPNGDNPEKAECFVGKSSLSQMLIDFDYADPV